MHHRWEIIHIKQLKQKQELIATNKFVLLHYIWEIKEKTWSQWEHEISNDKFCFHKVNCYRWINQIFQKTLKEKSYFSSLLKEILNYYIGHEWKWQNRTNTEKC
jgi:hypothetical protein